MDAIAAPPVKPYFFDACAMLALVRRETGAVVVDSILTDNDAVCYAHAVNVCEIYYDFVRSDGPAVARNVVSDLQALGVTIQDDIDQAFWQSVGDLKVNPGKLSLADCFALALTVRLGATLVTSDHHEFDPIAASGLAPILFIR